MSPVRLNHNHLNIPNRAESPPQILEYNATIDETIMQYVTNELVEYFGHNEHTFSEQKVERESIRSGEVKHLIIIENVFNCLI